MENIDKYILSLDSEGKPNVIKDMFFQFHQARVKNQDEIEEVSKELVITFLNKNPKIKAYIKEKLVKEE